ncbi:hypothetical protein Trydic_g2080 [Trypoxylus dichotomus]
MITLPYFLHGSIVEDTSRSATLNIPAAKLHTYTSEDPLVYFKTGCYYGWLKARDSDVYRVVMSVNHNEDDRTVDFHILHDEGKEFYGKDVNIILIDRTRGEFRFSDRDTFLQIVQTDIEYAKKVLGTPECQLFKNHAFFENYAVNECA